MEALLHHALHLLYFMMAPIAMLLASVLVAVVQRTRSGKSGDQSSVRKSPAYRPRYGHALEQQELDLLIQDLDHGRTRRGFSVLSRRH